MFTIFWAAWHLQPPLPVRARLGHGLDGRELVARDTGTAAGNACARWCLESARKQNVIRAAELPNLALRTRPPRIQSMHRVRSSSIHAPLHPSPPPPQVAAIKAQMRTLPRALPFGSTARRLRSCLRALRLLSGQVLRNALARQIRLAGRAWCVVACRNDARRLLERV
ncbi:hypothetical protein DFH06DRAFT_1464225 [Mycena polygramma]|nr:hypothetical protein DFH06DRAFT_1464225 [Mycena polygramma]